MNLSLETISTCNRYCPTCLRNSYPNKEKIASWFVPEYLPLEIIKEALRQYSEMRPNRKICLSHYNEPLLDERIVTIAEMAKTPFNYVYLNTNGDLLTPELEKSLNDILDEVYVSPPNSHFATHFSPRFDVIKLAKSYEQNLCRRPQKRIIINHKGQFLLCCEDIIGDFDLPRFPETSLEDYWSGVQHTKIINDLSLRKGRRKYPYCKICPRP